MRIAALLALLAFACGDDDPRNDGGHATDAGGDSATGPDAEMDLDAGAVDAHTDDAHADDGGAADADVDDSGASMDAATDGGVIDDASTGDAAEMRSPLLPGFCPSTVTAPGLYRGTLASNLNDIAGACGFTAPGRDGAVRVRLAPSERLRAVYRHAGDGVLYLLRSCPVVTSCLVGSDGSASGPETVEWTNDTGSSVDVSLVLDSTSLSGPQTFELDLFVD
ncbi:MAG: hypothetical protein KF901_21450 [Myxococcales bacterium]|nr:hypothetical protein [Myxococcales bacterium]